jgi:DNA-binding transcriptional LysR family regulator
VRESGSGTRSAMERFFREHKININKGMETDTTEAIKQAVQAGMGLGIMSQHTAELELETKPSQKSLNVQGFPIIRFWHVVNRKEQALIECCQNFREFLLKEAAKLMDESKN